MAKFINKKEEVIQLELTPAGKVLYSQGKFKPAFYAFYDDDILYDPDYSATGSAFIRSPASETQNQIVTRIKNTPRLGVQSTHQKTVSAQGDRFDRELISADKYLKPLGKSSPFSDYAPAWDIKTMETSVGFAGSMTGSRSGSTDLPAPYYADTNLAIPKLSASIEITYLKTEVEGTQNNRPATLPFWIILEDERLLIDVQELNTLFKTNGNFDVEVYNATPRTTAQKEGRSPVLLKKLGFINEESSDAEMLSAQKNPDLMLNLGLGSDDETIENAYPDLDDSYVEYYLSVRVDREIEDIPRRITPPAGIYTGVASTPEDPCD